MKQTVNYEDVKDVPYVKVAFLCKYIKHSWNEMYPGKGSWKRYVTASRCCGRCGKLENRKSSLITGSPYWFHVGYLDPEKVKDTE